MIYAAVTIAVGLIFPRLEYRYLANYSASELQLSGVITFIGRRI